MTSPDPSFADLAQRYDLFLFDAYGVLVDGTGALPGARAALELLGRLNKRCFVVTNDASSLPARTAARYASLGLPLAPEQIVTSGMLLEPHFAEHGLQGARCAVLGPPDGVHYVTAAGGRVVPADTDFDVLVVCDESGFPLLAGLDAALTSAIRRIDAGGPLHLVVPNPDILYPEGEQAFGFAAGSLALMFEAAFERRYPAQPGLRFARLGKPAPHLYRHALALAGPGRALFIGDQIETDIAGANAAGIDCALLTTGVSLAELVDLPPALRPTYRLSRLSA